MSAKKIFFWLPRLLSIFYILFLGIFALDVFSMEGSLPALVGGFLIHLIPNFILLGLLILAWKKELIGGIIFITLPVILALTPNFFPISIVLLAPVFLIGILFIAHYLKERR
ncbi:MAG: hypothetical protein ACM3IJ_05985 [Candidatus Levyibacteriota bacterium]